MKVIEKEKLKEIIGEINYNLFLEFLSEETKIISCRGFTYNCKDYHYTNDVCKFIRKNKDWFNYPYPTLGLIYFNSIFTMDLIHFKQEKINDVYQDKLDLENKAVGYNDKHQKYRSVQDRLLLMESLGKELQDKLRDYENLSEEEKGRFSFKFEKLVMNFHHVRCDVYDLYEEAKK